MDIYSEQQDREFEALLENMIGLFEDRISRDAWPVIEADIEQYCSKWPVELHWQEFMTNLWNMAGNTSMLRASM